MNPWLKLPGQLARTIYSHHRAHSRLSASVSGEEQVLRQVNTQAWNGVFDHQDGILAITTHALRFEITRGTCGKPAKGSVVIPLEQLQSVTVQPFALWSGKLVLQTLAGTKYYLFSLRGKADEIRVLIEQARSHV
jgi:hypothetical protein